MLKQQLTINDGIVLKHKYIYRTNNEKKIVHNEIKFRRKTIIFFIICVNTQISIYLYENLPFLYII